MGAIDSDRKKENIIIEIWISYLVKRTFKIYAQLRNSVETKCCMKCYRTFHHAKLTKQNATDRAIKKNVFNKI